jgi:hypothetical protein
MLRASRNRLRSEETRQMIRSHRTLVIAACFAVGCAAATAKDTPDDDFGIVVGDAPSDAHSRRVIVQGQLAYGEEIESAYPTDGAGYHGWTFEGRAGHHVILSVTAIDPSDSVLAVFGPRGEATWADAERIAKNDDASAGSSDSGLQLALPADGEYLVLVREFQDGPGRFRLSLGCAGDCRAAGVVVDDEDTVACEIDSDCVAIEATCCPCNFGGTMRAVSREHQESAAPDCSTHWASACADGLYLCDGRVPACVSGRCELVAPPAEHEMACGGLGRYLSCGASSYCHFPAGTGCGFDDQRGACVRRPDYCPDDYVPVCGCDNVSHNNACQAARRGAAVAHEGPCARR